MTNEDVAIGQRVTLNSGGPVSIIVDIDPTDANYVQIAWRNIDGSVTEDWLHISCVKKVECG